MPRWRGQYRSPERRRRLREVIEEVEVVEDNRSLKWIREPLRPVVDVPLETLEDHPGFNDVNPREEYRAIDATATLLMSRIYILLFQFIGGRFEISTDAFQGHRVLERSNMTSADLSIQEYWFRGLMRWDALQFMFIAQYGYIFEHSLAFLPAFPWATGALGASAADYYRALVGPVHKTTMTLLMGLIINTFTFLQAGHVLYFITLRISKSQKAAIISTILFAFNPASIFFTSFYSESLYTLVTFGAIFLLLEMKVSDDFPFFLRLSGAVMIMMLGCVIRGNGILNVGYLGWFLTREIFWTMEEAPKQRRVVPSNIFPRRRSRYAREDEGEVSRPLKCTFLLKRGRTVAFARLFFGCFILTMAVVFAVSLWVAYGNHQSDNFCNSRAFMRVPQQFREYAQQNRLTVIGETRRMPWCAWLEKNKNTVQATYGFPVWYPVVQRKYWRVGHFAYWSVKKIPCFLMAAPAMLLTLIAIRGTFRDLARRNLTNIWMCLLHQDHLLPYAIHSAVILYFGIFYINAEVFTRMIFSSSPFLYVYYSQWLAQQTSPAVPEGRVSYFLDHTMLYPPYLVSSIFNDRYGRLFYLYFFAYFVFGTVMHAMFLPFT
ncbi:unnamed protein product [Caenorhabditis auriculariae]|uniref:GPI mannosyltransferase 2 n=1 Tax=Caenorhabditis auriculariae TaxID=2777116 RepID=A0A8S1GMH6_9PELO|nr:unnamed protein product [Caenorhabditis auriculariae]